jgi:FtsH-binding integral membrane protein
MSRRFQFSLGRFVLSGIVLCVALALFGYGLRAENGVLHPFLYVGASGIAVAMSIGLLAKQIRWLVIGAVIGEVAYGCLFWMCNVTIEL